MLRLDMQAGSRDYAPYLRAVGLPVEEVPRLPAGDVEFLGRGAEGLPVLVGVELKKCADLLQCVRDGRLSEQLRAMQDRHEVKWLVIEGEWRDEHGHLALMERKGWKSRGKYTYQEVAAYALTMAQCGGAMLWRTADRDETVAWLKAMYWWWTAKDFEDHRAHLQWYTPPRVKKCVEPTPAQKVAAALLSTGPTVNVNSKLARAAGEHFKRVGRIFKAGEADWMEIEGVGAKTARRIMEVVE